MKHNVYFNMRLAVEVEACCEDEARNIAEEFVNQDRKDFFSQSKDVLIEGLDFVDCEELESDNYIVEE